MDTKCTLNYNGQKIDVLVNNITIEHSDEGARLNIRVDGYINEMKIGLDKAAKGEDKTVLMTMTPFAQEWVKQAYFDSAKYAHVFELDEDNEDAMSYFNKFFENDWQYNNKKEEEMCAGQDRCEDSCARDCDMKAVADNGSNLVSQLNYLELSDEDKLLREYNIVREDGVLTNTGKELLLNILLKDNKTKIVAALTDLENAAKAVKSK